MAYDNRPNLSDRRFEQSTGDTMSFCGTNNFHGQINSGYGYRISGVTFISMTIGLKMRALVVEVQQNDMVT